MWIDNQVLEAGKNQIKATKSVIFFTYAVSRPATALFYDNLPAERFPASVPHRKPVHSGFFIYNHKTGEVEDVIEGAFRNNTLIVLRNKDETKRKLENSGQLLRTEDYFVCKPNEEPHNRTYNVYGHWHKAYNIRLKTLSVSPQSAKQIFDDFESEFNSRSEGRPIPYILGCLDSQTCAHHLLIRLQGHDLDKNGKKLNPYSMPFDDCTLGWREDGKSPMDLRDQLEAELAARGKSIEEVRTLPHMTQKKFEFIFQHRDVLFKSCDKEMTLHEMQDIIFPYDEKSQSLLIRME